MKSLEIQVTGPSDFDAIARLWETTEKASPVPLGGRWTREKIQVQVESACGYKVISAATGELVAFVLYRAQAQGFEVDLLATHPDWRGMGAMQMLLRHLQKQMFPGTEIWLEVHGKNHPAQQLYQKAGFQMVGERRNYYGPQQSAALYTYVARGKGT